MIRTGRASRRLVLLLVATAAVSGALGVGGARVIRSPEQVRADAAAPEPTVLTARAESAALISHLVLTGTVDAPRGTTVRSPQDGVVTRSPVSVGDRVVAGDAVLVVNDRPILVLPGSVPLYRSLQPDDRGPDVRRFQKSLRAAGRDVPLDGIVGSSTRRAIGELYRAAGFPPPGRERAAVESDEFAFVPRLPARVIGVGGRLGGPATEASVRLSDRAPIVAASVNPADVRDLRVGQRARCGPASRPEMGCRISSIGGPRTTPDGVQVPVQVSTDQPLPLRDDGVTVRIRIATRVAGRGLVVPSAAIRTDRAGEEYVEVRDEESRHIRIEVDVLAEAHGRVQVAATDERLAAGAEVVVGADRVRR